MTGIPGFSFPSLAHFHFLLLDVAQTHPETRLLVPRLPAVDAPPQNFAFVQPSPASMRAEPTTVSSTDAAGWSIQSFSFVDANGTSSELTVIGGSPGQDPRSDLGPPTHPGTPGDDVIVGGPGRDTIAGGLGDDTLSGSGDADTFLYSAGDGSDTITDFQRGADRLVLLGVTGVSFVSNGDVATVTLADGSQLTLRSAAPIPIPNGDVAPLE